MYSTPVNVLKISVLLVLFQVLFACGGGKKDTTPDAFSFTSQTDVALSTVATSNSVTVIGINKPASISVSGGEYSVNGGAFSTASSTVKKNDSVQVRLTSSASIDTAVTATLNIGGVSGSFTVTTIGDTTPPSSEIIFPSPVSLTDGSSVTVRGRASDDFGPVSEINITVMSGATVVDTVVLTATASDDFISTWSASVDLMADSLNEIAVLATDAAGNQQAVAATVEITQDSSGLETNFPVGNDVYWDEMSAIRQIDLDLQNNRLLIGPHDANGVSLNQINSVDLSTGVRSSISPDLNLASFYSVNSVQFDGASNKIYYCTNREVYEFDVALGQHSLVSDINSPNSNINMIEAGNMALHSDGRMFISDAIEGVYTVDLSTGSRTLVSTLGGTKVNGIYLDELNNRFLTASIQDGGFLWVDISTDVVTPIVSSGAFSSYRMRFAVDEDDNRLFYFDATAKTFSELNLTTGISSLLFSSVFPSGSANTTFDDMTGIDINGADNIGYLVTGRAFDETVWVYMVDLNTGERVVLTRSVKPLL